MLGPVLWQVKYGCVQLTARTLVFNTAAWERPYLTHHGVASCLQPLALQERAKLTEGDKDRWRSQMIGVSSGVLRRPRPKPKSRRRQRVYAPRMTPRRERGKTRPKRVYGL